MCEEKVAKKFQIITSVKIYVKYTKSRFRYNYVFLQILVSILKFSLEYIKQISCWKIFWELIIYFQHCHIDMDIKWWLIRIFNFAH